MNVCSFAVSRWHAWNGDPASCLLNLSRSVLYAEDPRSEAERVRAAINAAIDSLAAVPSRGAAEGQREGG